MAQNGFSLFDGTNRPDSNDVSVDKEGRPRVVIRPQNKVLKGSLGAGMVGQTSDPRKTDFPFLMPFIGPEISDEPALEPDPSKIEYEYGEPFLGAKSVTKRRRPVVDPTKVTPIVSVKDLNIPEQDVLDAKYVESKTGERFKFTSQDTYQTRLNIMDQAQATNMVFKVGDREHVVPLPFEKITEDYTRLPDDIREKLVNIPFISDEETYRYMINLGYDEDTNRAIFANQFVKYLKNQGVEDERTIAGIVAHSVNLPQFGGVGFGDTSKLLGLTNDIVRFPIEAGMYIVGEAYDAITEDSNPEGFDLEDSIDRQRFLDQYLPRTAAVVQDRYAQIGLDVPYTVAEGIARRFSGIGTQFVATAAEVTGGTGLATLTKRLGGASEARQFKNWAGDYSKRFPDIAEEDLIAKYLDIRKSQVFGKDVAGLSQNLKDIKLIGGVAKIAAKPIAFINSIRVSNRFKAGMQLEDAALSVSNRIEVRNMANFRRDLIKQRSGITERAKREGRPLTSKETDKLADVERKLLVSRRELRKIVAESETPKFIREAGVQDAYIIIGSAAANQAFEIYGGDPMLGDFLGAVGGIGFSLLKGRNEAKKLLQKFNLEKTNNAKLMNAADLILTNMKNLSPEFQEALRTRVNYFNGLKQSLIQEGVDPEVLERSALRMMGLSVLQVIEEGHRLEMRGPQAASFAGNFEALSDNLRTQQSFAAELRTTLQRLANAEGVQTDGTAVNKLYTTVDAALKHADGMIAQLDDDLGVLGRNYEKQVRGLVLGTDDKLGFLDEDSVNDLASTFQRLSDHNIKRIDNKSVEAIRNEATRTNADVVEAIGQKSRQIARNLPTHGDVQQKVEKVLPDGRIIRPGREPVKTGEIKTPGDALAAVIESTNVRERNIASAPYRKLDAEVFVTPDGRRIDGIPTTDAGPVLDEMFKVLGTDDGITILLEMSGRTMSKSTSSKVFNFMDDVAGGFLTSLAEVEGRSVDELVDAAMQAAGDYDKRIPKNLFAAMQIRKDLAADNIDVGVLPLSFVQAKELTDAFSQMAFKAPEAAAAKLRNLENIAEGTMDNFSVRLPNGQVVPIQQLNVADETSPTGVSSVRDYLRKANEGWSEYKRRYYNDENLGKWLGWKNKDSRLPTGISPNYPLGIDYGANAPIKWLDFEKIANAKPEDQQLLMRSLAEGIGIRGADNVYRVQLNTPEGQALREVLGAHMREWMINTLESGKAVNFNDFRTKIKSLENAFDAVTEDGNKVALIDGDRILRDVFPDFGSDSLNEDIFNTGVEKINSAIKRESARVTREAKVIRQGLAASRQYLDRFTAGRLDAKDAASVLISGGTARVTEVKQHLKLLGRSDTEINDILKSLIIDEVEKKAFKLTGVHTIDSQNPNKLIPEVNLDEEQLKTIMGFNDSTTAAVVRSIVGDRTYDIYKSIVEFTANEKLSGMQGLNMTGIPRTFSIESYISRFYAVNRGVVSFRYVGTEAVLQEMRRKNMSILTQALTNPEVGELVMEMIATGKPLPAQKEDQLFELLVVGMERFDNWRERAKDPVKVVSDFGHEYMYNSP